MLSLSVANKGDDFRSHLVGQNSGGGQLDG